MPSQSNHVSIIFSLVLLGLGSISGCASDGPDGPTGEYQIQWTLVPPPSSSATCSALEVDQIVATITDVATNDTHIQMAPCSAGAMVTDPLPLGDHQVQLEALGLAGERATVSPEVTHGTLATDGQTLALPPQSLAILAPTMKTHSTWNLTRNGAPSNCGDLLPNGVAIVTTPDGGQAQRDVWDCAESNATVDVPLSSFAAYAQLLGSGDAVVATSATATVDAKRGVVELVFDLDSL